MCVREIEIISICFIPIESLTTQINFLLIYVVVHIYEKFFNYYYYFAIKKFRHFYFWKKKSLWRHTRKGRFQNFHNVSLSFNRDFRRPFLIFFFFFWGWQGGFIHMNSLRKFYRVMSSFSMRKKTRKFSFSKMKDGEGGGETGKTWKEQQWAERTHNYVMKHLFNRFFFYKTTWFFFFFLHYIRLENYFGYFCQRKVFKGSNKQEL